MKLRIFANNSSKDELQCGIKLCINNPNNVKFFLSSILAVIACISSYASENRDILQGQNSQPKIYSKDSSYIYIAENAKIHGKEYLFDKKITQQPIAKNGSKTKDITTEPAKNNINKKVPSIIIFPDFPFLPSSSSYSRYNKESAVTGSQQKLKKYQLVSKTYWTGTYPGIEKSNLFFIPEQRHKFSPAATQCGILTSFISNAPPL